MDLMSNQLRCKDDSCEEKDTCARYIYRKTKGEKNVKTMVKSTLKKNLICMLKITHIMERKNKR